VSSMIHDVEGRVRFDNQALFHDMNGSTQVAGSSYVVGDHKDRDSFFAEPR
jgi:hypothetical protein